MIIQEELKAKNGPQGSKYGTILDKDTNEPIATYAKDNYYKTYTVKWHPTFLALNPSVAASHEAASIIDTSGYKTGPESLGAAVAHAERAHTHMANLGFQDRHDIRATQISDKETHLAYHDRKTGDHLATRVVTAQDYGEPKVTAGLSSDFVAKHNIPEAVVATTNAALTRSTKAHDFAYALNNTVAELAKKKAATGLHAFGNAITKVYHASGTPEETSAEHEAHLIGKGYSVNRLSPSHFIATAGNREETVHSIASGDKLHAIHTTVAGYSARNLANTHSF